MQVFQASAQVNDVVGLANAGISSDIAKRMHKQQVCSTGDGVPNSCVLIHAAQVQATMCKLLMAYSSVQYVAASAYRALTALELVQMTA